MIFRTVLACACILAFLHCSCLAQSSDAGLVYKGHLVVHQNAGERSAQGIDISSTRNEVRSLSEGKVTASFIVAGRHSVIVQSDTHFYVYGKLASSSFRTGDEVKKGQVIGTMLPAEANSYQQHFEVWKNERSVDAAILNYIETKHIAGFSGPN